MSDDESSGISHDEDLFDDALHQENEKLKRKNRHLKRQIKAAEKEIGK